MKENQEDNLLGDNNQEIPIDPPKQSNQKKYIPFLPKAYWFFYHKPIYFLIIIPIFLDGFLQIGNPLMISAVIDALNKENGLQLIKRYAFYQFLNAIINGIFSLLSTYSKNQVKNLIEIKIKRVIFKSLMMKDIEFYDKKNFGEIYKTLNKDTQKLTRLFSFYKFFQISMLGTIVSDSIFCFTLNWQLTVFAIVFTISINYGAKIFAEKGEKYMHLYNSHESNLMNIINESISNIRTIFSFNSQKREIESLTEECDASYKGNFYFKLYYDLTNQVLFLMNNGSLCIFLNIGCYFILKNKLTTGQLFTLSTQAFSLAYHFLTFYSMMENEKMCLKSTENIFNLIDYIPNVPFTNEGRQIENFSGRIEFRDVWFKYPTRNSWVLKNVSFVISPGEISAIVGHSGSGKSTILQLILRFYDTSSGSIFFDDIDIRELDPRWIHRAISVVQQEPCLFSLSIRENILYGLDKNFYEKKFGLSGIDFDELKMNQKVDLEVDRCLEIAQAKNFVNELPHNKDSLIGEKGVKLSGGQKQRIAIARAVIRDPVVLITDEATSALDAENENKVQMALDEIMENRTSIIIAHRLGTIKKAKTIYVFDSGELLESGSRDELIEKKGAFYNLVERQLNINE